MTTPAFLTSILLCAAAMVFLQRWHVRRKQATAVRPALIAGLLLISALLVTVIDLGWQRAPFMLLGILSMVALIHVITVNLYGAFSFKV